MNKKTELYYRKEIDGIYSFLNLDYQKKGTNQNIPFLIARIVKGEVMLHYSYLTMFLDLCILRYFYPAKTDMHYIKKRSDKFKNFVDYFLQEASFLKKVKFIKSIVNTPKRISCDLERINALRNAIGHEGVKAIFPNYDISYKGKDIYSLEGLRLFSEDSNRIQSFLQCKESLQMKGK